jgi:hypothetical protein
VKPHDRLALALCGLFVVLGSLWISSPGIQADEVLFAGGIYQPEQSALTAWVFGKRVPLMQMSYVGSLKTWLYAPLFAAWKPSAASLRLPMVLAGGLMLWLVYLLMRDAVSPEAGLVALLLLAADPSLVWTTRCDWGPSVLQHLLTAGGVLAMFRQRCGVGAFLFGLAFWDKAVFVWLLAGLGVAALILRKRIRASAAAVAVLAFLLGAYPLLRFNVSRGGETARQTVHLTTEGIASKITQLAATLDGGALFSYLVRDREAGPKSTYASLLFLACVAALPLLRRDPFRRAAWFFLTLVAVAWLSMAFTRGGGESVQHIVLLWPWPHCMMAVVLACFPRRVGLVPAAAVLIAGLAVTGNYYSMLKRHGADPPWSEAIYALTGELAKQKAEAIYITDWGILEPVRVLSNGRLPLHYAYEGIQVEEGALYVAHTDPHEEFPNANRRLDAPDYRRIVVSTVPDRQGETIYQIFRYQPVH